MWKISDMFAKAEEVTPIMFEHLLMCAELTDTKMVTSRFEHDNAMLWANEVVKDAAVRSRMTVKANYAQNERGRIW